MVLAYFWMYDDESSFHISTGVMETSPFRTNNLVAQTSTDEKQHQSSITRGAHLKEKTCRVDGTLTNVLHFPMVIDVETTYSIRSKYALHCLLIIGNPGGPKLEPKNGAQTYGARSGAVLSIPGSGPVYFCSIQETQFWAPFWVVRWAATDSDVAQQPTCRSRCCGLLFADLGYLICRGSAFRSPSQ